MTIVERKSYIVAVPSLEDKLYLTERGFKPRHKLNECHLKIFKTYAKARAYMQSRYHVDATTEFIQIIEKVVDVNDEISNN